MKIGFTKHIINPEFPAVPVGFVSHTNAESDICGDLYVRFTYLEDKDTRIALFSFDNAGITLDVQEKIIQEIQSYYPANTEFIFTVTHTHFAPALGNLFGVFEADSRYLTYVTSILKTLYKDSRFYEDDITVSYTFEPFNQVGRSRLSSGNDKNIVAGILSFYHRQKRVLNMIHYNCHPTISAEDSPFLSSDYPGKTIELLEISYPTEHFIFLQGADGDVSTRFTRKEKSYSEVIRLSLLLKEKYDELLNKSSQTLPFSLSHASMIFPLHHQVKDFDICSIDMNAISEKEARELRTAEKVIPNMKKYIHLYPSYTRFDRLTIGSYRLVFNAFELFSNYRNYFDASTLLVCYSQGLLAYLTTPDNTEISYEALMETITNDDKQKIVEVLKTL